MAVLVIGQAHYLRDLPYNSWFKLQDVSSIGLIIGQGKHVAVVNLYDAHGVLTNSHMPCSKLESVIYLGSDIPFTRFVH